ncbi:hypothetical protein J6590_060870 [Homalodisca vitripennis]|nr:hypothetical protein J6590_060870 [Homalodisca vitripennis]
MVQGRPVLNPGLQGHHYPSIPSYSLFAFLFIMRAVDRCPTTVSSAVRLQVARYMNTYRLEAKRPFNAESVRPLLREILTRDLAEAHYEPNNISKLGVNIAGEIRSKVKQLNFDR